MWVGEVDFFLGGGGEFKLPPYGPPFVTENFWVFLLEIKTSKK
jgi:hypothetical protein